MKKKSSESVSRSFVKTITYRIVIIISTYLVSFFITRDHALSISITSISSVANTILYFLHERFWSVIKWGRAR